MKMKKNLIDYELLWEKITDYAIIGWIDEAVSLVYAYKKVCRYVTPEIESEVDNILERWFPEGKYELIEE